MEPKTNYTMIGIAVLILSSALLSSLLWLSVGFERKKYHTYTVYVGESVNGLNDESPVKFNGVKVGMISRIELSHANPQRIKLSLKIIDGVLISTGTRATLVTQGITGVTYLGLTAISPTQEPLKRIGNEPHPVIPYKPSFFNRLEDNITEVSSSLKRVFDQENAKNFKAMLSNFEKITNTFSKNNQNINQSLRDLPGVIQELKVTARQVGTMATTISEASSQFSQQAIAPTTVLLKRLDIIAANLEQVSALMRQNPAVIIRGTTPQQSGPGE